MKWIKATDRKPEDWSEVVVAAMYGTSKSVICGFSNESYDYWLNHPNGQEYLNELVWLDESDRERPKPLDWLRYQKFKIPEGASFIMPEVSARQCAAWIEEYIRQFI